MLRVPTGPLRCVLVLMAAAVLFGCGDGPRGGGAKIREFTEHMQWHDGFLPFYADERSGRVYLVLDAERRELLYQTSLPRGIGSNDIGLDRGQFNQGGAFLVRFEPVGERVLLRRLNTRYRAQSDQAPERRAAEEAFASSVLWGFPVVARDGAQLLLDATEFLLRDSHGVARRLAKREQGEFQVDLTRSAPFLPRSRAFPRNTELEAIVTFTGDEPGEFVRDVAPDPYALTVHMHHSFVALPEDGYRPRRFHPESGFWPQSFVDYAVPLSEPLEQRFIARHRLHKRDPAAPLSRAVEPIVYYLDPGTPEPIRSALLEGAGWWADAFEAAGFEDAFRVEMLPADADPMDVRFNVIQWVHRATRGWSYGISVVDPRSGEIIKGHVTLGSLRVRQDLLIARGMTSPFSAEGDADALTSAMALARIRQLSAHEVGHTLGLAHNFAASVRDRASVMDYPHPRLRLSAAGEVVLEDAYASGIGAWDKRAILYGYGDFGDAAAEGEALRAVLAENRREGFEFISDPDARESRDFHPRAHLWDDGSDPVQELVRALALRDVALARFGRGSIPPGTAFSELERALVPVYFYHRYPVQAVGKMIGGADYRYPLRGELAAGEQPLRYLAPERQAEALAALLATLEPSRLLLPRSLLSEIPPRAFGYERDRESPAARTGALFDPLTLAESAAALTLEVLLHRERLARVALQAAVNPAQLSLDGLFRGLHEALLVPEYPGLAGAVGRRTAGVLLAHWRSLLGTGDAAPEVRAAARAALQRAHSALSTRSSPQVAYRDFYALEAQHIREALERREPLADPAPPAPPPGSPIGAGP